MQTKTCPSCGNDVPTVAHTCKHCFHRFDEAPRKSHDFLYLFLAFALMAGVGAGLFYYLSSQPTDTRILVDDEAETIQWVRQFQDGSLETDRMPFSDIKEIEYVVTATGNHEIAAISVSGERKVFHEDRNKGLELQAERYAKLMDKPLKLRNDTRSFLDE